MANVFSGTLPSLSEIRQVRSKPKNALGLVPDSTRMQVKRFWVWDFRGNMPQARLFLSSFTVRFRAGLLILARLWRFARIGHAVFLLREAEECLVIHTLVPARSEASFAPNSFLFLLVRHLLLEAMHLFLVSK